jgi:hypothetical protein
MRKRLPRLTSVESVIHGVLKVSFDDGYVGVVDLRPWIAQGKIFTWLQSPENFNAVRLNEYGHSISWFDANGYEIDMAADTLRRDAERQAEIHKLMVG